MIGPMLLLKYSRTVKGFSFSNVVEGEVNEAGGDTLGEKRPLRVPQAT